MFLLQISHGFLMVSPYLPGHFLLKAHLHEEVSAAQQRLARQEAPLELIENPEEIAGTSEEDHGEPYGGTIWSTIWSIYLSLLVHMVIVRYFLSHYELTRPCHG